MTYNMGFDEMMAEVDTALNTSLDFPGPKGAFPASGLHPSTCIFKFSEALLNEDRPVLFGDKRVYRQTARRITGACFRMSGTSCFMARSTPKMQLVRVRLFDFVEA